MIATNPTTGAPLMFARLADEHWCVIINHDDHAHVEGPMPWTDASEIFERHVRLRGDGAAKITVLFNRGTIADNV